MTSVREEYDAVRIAVRKAMLDTSAPNYAHLLHAEANLETTYITRLFSEFEGILKQYLLANDPRRRASREAYNRINRVARLFSIPDDIRDRVHIAREYRNSVIHPGGAARPTITFSVTLSSLNRFLAPLL